MSRGNKAAVALLAKKGRGESEYCDGCGVCGEAKGYICHGGYYNALFLYDPKDLTDVATGLKNPWDPKPYLTIDLTPHLWPGESPLCPKVVNGMEYDSERGFLYIQQKIGNGGKSVISVFKINANPGGDILPPAPPANLRKN